MSRETKMPLTFEVGMKRVDGYLNVNTKRCSLQFSAVLFIVGLNGFFLPRNYEDRKKMLADKFWQRLIQNFITS